MWSANLPAYKTLVGPTLEYADVTCDPSSSRNISAPEIQEEPFVLWQSERKRLVDFLCTQAGITRLSRCRKNNLSGCMSRVAHLKKYSRCGELSGLPHRLITHLQTGAARIPTFFYLCRLASKTYMWLLYCLRVPGSGCSTDGALCWSSVTGIVRAVFCSPFQALFIMAASSLYGFYGKDLRDLSEHEVEFSREDTSNPKGL